MIQDGIRQDVEYFSTEIICTLLQAFVLLLQIFCQKKSFLTTTNIDRLDKELFYRSYLYPIANYCVTALNILSKEKKRVSNNTKHRKQISKHCITISQMATRETSELFVWP